jgi:hypothetical protein
MPAETEPPGTADTLVAAVHRLVEAGESKYSTVGVTIGVAGAPHGTRLTHSVPRPLTAPQTLTPLPRPLLGCFARSTPA